MIKVSPVTDPAMARKAFDAHGLPYVETSAVLVAADGRDKLGECFVQMTEQGVEILSISCEAEDPSLIDWLMRSAMNYAANRGAYLAYCRLPEYEQTLLALSFEKKDGYYVGEVPEIFKGCLQCRSGTGDSGK